jgi:hypothetical protein
MWLVSRQRSEACGQATRSISANGLLDEVVRRGGGVSSDDATVVVVKFD